jgi:hypothetical protein
MDHRYFMTLHSRSLSFGGTAQKNFIKTFSTSSSLLNTYLLDELSFSEVKYIKNFYNKIETRGGDIDRINEPNGVDYLFEEHSSEDLYNYFYMEFL